MRGHSGRCSNGVSIESLLATSEKAHTFLYLDFRVKDCEFEFVDVRGDSDNNKETDVAFETITSIDAILAGKLKGFKRLIGNL